MAHRPAHSGGPAGSLGDIGTHAYNLACFVSGVHAEQVAAELTIFVPGRRLDDNVQMLLRYEGGARGMLWASQVAPATKTICASASTAKKGGIEWRQEEPNTLRFGRYGKPPRLITRGGAGGHRSGGARQPHSLRPSRGLPRSLRSDLQRHRRTNRRARSQALALEAIAARAHRR